MQLLRTVAAVAIAPLLLAGCGSSGADPTPASTVAGSPTTTTSSSSTTTAPSEAPVSASSPASTMTHSSTPGAPEQATMICGEEVQSRLKTVLGLSQQPKGTSSWQPPLYTCTYRLPSGPLVLTVRVLASSAAARTAFEQQRATTPGAKPIQGLASLGLPSYETQDGLVGFAKDNFVFRADAHAMREPIGPAAMTRTAFAYSISATVLACWSEH